MAFRSYAREANACEVALEARPLAMDFGFTLKFLSPEDLP